MRRSDYSDKTCSLCGSAMIPNIWHKTDDGAQHLGEFYPSGITGAKLTITKRVPTMMSGLIKRHEKSETLDLCMACGSSLNEWTASRHPVTCLCSSSHCPGKIERDAKRDAARAKRKAS